jgi:hypothetical protein
MCRIRPQETFGWFSHQWYKYLPDPITLYVSIPMCNVKWLCLCILFWQVPHRVVSVPNDGFMECNKWMNECTLVGHV